MNGKHKIKSKKLIVAKAASLLDHLIHKDLLVLPLHGMLSSLNVSYIKELHEM